MSDTGKQFSIQRIFVKDISFESPATPEIFRLRVEPRVELAFRVEARALGEDRHEVVLAATVTARTEERTVFLCEVQQAGVFIARGVEPADLDELLNVACPTQLFPFLRELVVDLTVKGGFPPVLIAPVKFEEMYAASRRPAAGQA